MHALLALTVANIRSFVRDRAALFWTLAFPLDLRRPVRADLLGRRASTLNARLGRPRRARRPSPQLRAGLRRRRRRHLIDDDPRRRPMEPDEDRQGTTGSSWSRQGYGAAVAAAGARDRARPRRPRSPSTPTRARRPRPAIVEQVVGSVLGMVNLGGRPPVVVADVDQTIRDPDLTRSATSSRASSGMALMQLGHLRRDPARGRPPEDDPQAPERDAAAALAAGRQQRADAAAHRASSRRSSSSAWASPCSGSSRPAACLRVGPGRARLAGVHLAGLRHRLVRHRPRTPATG